MSAENKYMYEKAFELKNEGQFQEAIDEFKLILEKSPNDVMVAGMVAALSFSEFNDPKMALPYAQEAVAILPNNELASFCLLLCLFKLNEKDLMRAEIERYVRTGRKIDLYRALFEENDLTIEDFT